MIIQVFPGVWLEILDIIRQLPHEILYVLYYNAYVISPPLSSSVCSFRCMQQFESVRGKCLFSLVLAGCNHPQAVGAITPEKSL